MKAALALVLALAIAPSWGCSGCGNDAVPNHDDAGTGDAPPPFNACTADAPSFVRQAFVALIGRRPKSQDEVDVYVDLYTAAQTKGLDPKDSQKILHGLREFATSEPYMYHHKWKVGDTVLWDNRTSLHRATPYDPNSGRMMRRTILRGGEAWEQEAR